jgi:hypothetical protein
MKKLRVKNRRDTVPFWLGYLLDEVVYGPAIFELNIRGGWRTDLQA